MNFAMFLGFATISTAFFGGLAFGQSGCGSLQNHFGPFDYRIERDKARSVESHHFNTEVEALRRGQSGSFGPGADIEYLLRVFPNHHRGLAALTRLRQKLNQEHVDHMLWPLECYFERALRFQPDDTIARLLYASYLIGRNRVSDVDVQLKTAIITAADNAFTHFNIGMMYFDLKNYPLALSQAHRALDLGFTKPDLKDRLVAAGKWVEPAKAVPADSPASAASPAASSTAGQ